jgi:hypothetical protein
MPNDPEQPQSHLVWRLQPRAHAAKHLQRSGCRELPDSSSQDTVAVLYVYGSSGSPKAITWEAYRSESGSRLMREAMNVNRFDAWFESNRDANMWTIATVWRFYRDWVVGYNVPHWQSCLQKHFPYAPLLDQVLSVSRGWILWDFQVELVCGLAMDNASDAKRAAESWRLQHWRGEAPPTDAVLPDGSSLIGVLHERSWKERHGGIMPFGYPDLALAHALQTLG